MQQQRDVPYSAAQSPRQQPQTGDPPDLQAAAQGPYPVASLAIDFHAVAASVVAEVQAGLQAVRSEDVAKFQRLLSSARRIVCFGVGREGLVLKAFAMRLFHIEFQASSAFEMTTPPIGAGDLLVVSAGPGFFSTVAAMAETARTAGAHVLSFTYNPTAALTFADSVIRIIPSQSVSPVAQRHEHNLVQRAAQARLSSAAAPGSSLLLGSGYEASLALFLDTVGVILAAERAVTDAHLRQAHTNLE